MGNAAWVSRWRMPSASSPSFRLSKDTYLCDIRPDCHHHFDARGTSNAMFDDWVSWKSLMSPMAGTKHTYVSLVIIIHCNIKRSSANRLINANKKIFHFHYFARAFRHNKEFNNVTSVTKTTETVPFKTRLRWELSASDVKEKHEEFSTLQHVWIFTIRVR